MADMRANDWGVLLLAGAIILACIVGCMLLIVLWPHIVSIVSGLGARARAEGQARRAYRQRVYDRAIMSRQEFGAPVSTVVSSVSNTNTDTGIKSIDTAALALHLTEDQYIEIGALMRNRNGKPVFSGKKLYGLAGGNYNEFVAKMRQIRGDGEAMEEQVSYTPYVGRPTSARFDLTDPDYPYQAPA